MAMLRRRNYLLLIPPLKLPETDATNLCNFAGRKRSFRDLIFRVVLRRFDHNGGAFGSFEITAELSDSTRPEGRRSASGVAVQPRLSLGRAGLSK